MLNVFKVAQLGFYYGHGPLVSFGCSINWTQVNCGCKQNFKFLGTRWEAACYGACGPGFMNPTFTSCEIYLSGNFLCSAPCFLILALTGCLVVSRDIFMDGTSAGPSLPSLEFNISLCISIDSLKFYTPAFDNPFLEASFIRWSNYLHISSGASSPKST